jgi:DNA polymerase III gamma/tau subunit
MLQSHLLSKHPFMLTLVGLALRGVHAPDQLSGTSAASKQQSTPTILPNTRQTSQPAQPSQQVQSQSPSTTGSTPLSRNQMLVAGGIVGNQQQPSLTDLLLQQQLQQAYYSGIQQMQMNAQAQAAQQQYAAQLAASQQRSSLAARRKERRVEPEDPDSFFAKPDIKVMGEESAEKVSARQLRLARDIKGDADRAEQQGDRVQAAKLRVKVGHRLTEIVDKYKGTPASKEAAKLLEDLYPE